MGMGKKGVEKRKFRRGGKQSGLSIFPPGVCELD